MSTAATLANLNAPNIAVNNAYNTAIDSTTRSALSSIGAWIAKSDYTLTYEDIANTFFTKIGLTMITKHQQVDKFRQFHAVGDGKDIEEIHVGDYAGYAYDKTGANVLADQGEPTINVNYSKQQRRSQYAMTIRDLQWRPVFNDITTKQDFIYEHFNRMTQSIKKDDYILGKKCLGMIDFTQGNMTYQVPTVTSAKSVQTFLRTLKKASMDMTFNNTLLNEGGVDAICDKSDQVLFINKDVLSHVDVDVLAGVFNIDKIDIANRIIVLDDFGQISNCCGILMDTRKMRIYDDVVDVEAQRNAKGRFTNYFYNVWATYRISPYRQAIKFEYTSES